MAVCEALLLEMKNEKLLSLVRKIKLPIILVRGCDERESVTFRWWPPNG